MSAHKMNSSMQIQSKPTKQQQHVKPDDIDHHAAISTLTARFLGEIPISSKEALMIFDEIATDKQCGEEHNDETYTEE